MDWTQLTEEDISRIRNFTPYAEGKFLTQLELDIHQSNNEARHRCSSLYRELQNQINKLERLATNHIVNFQKISGEDIVNQHEQLMAQFHEAWHMSILSENLWKEWLRHISRLQEIRQGLELRIREPQKYDEFNPRI